MSDLRRDTDLDRYPPPRIELPCYEGDVPGLTRSLRTGSIRPSEVDLVAVVTVVLAWFDEVARVDLEEASVALPQVASLIESKARLLLPAPARPTGGDDEDRPDDEATAVAIRVLEELEEAIDFLRHRRLERRLVVPARAPKPDLPRPVRRLGIDVARLKRLADTLRPGAYFDLVDERWTVSTAMRRLRAVLSNVAGGALSRLMPARTWEDRTVTFAAMLELVRTGDVEAHQEAPYEDIQLSWRGGTRPV